MTNNFFPRDARVGKNLEAIECQPFDGQPSSAEKNKRAYRSQNGISYGSISRHWYCAISTRIVQYRQGLWNIEK